MDLRTYRDEDAMHFQTYEIRFEEFMCMYVHTCAVCASEDSLKHVSWKFWVASLCLSSKRWILLACINYCTAVPKSDLKQSSLDISALCWDLYLNF